MRKTIFFTLLSANALFLAWRLGYLDSMIPSGHEPARMLAQFNADKVRRAAPVAAAPSAPPGQDGAGHAGGTGVAGEGNASAPQGAATGATGGAGTPGTTGPAAAPGAVGTPGATGKSSAATGASGASASAASASTPAGGSGAASAPVVAPSGGLKSVVASAATAAAAAAGAATCVDVAGFNTVDARRFAAQVAAAIPGAKLTRREAPETSRQMVYIPPQGSREGAEKKAAELRRLGVTDLYIIQDNSPQRWGISLGIFRSDEAARAHLTALMRQGVRSARLLDMHVALTRLAYRVDGLDPAALARLDSIRSEYSRQDWRSCQ